MKKHISILAVMIGGILASCTDNGVTYQPETVVEAYLYVGEPIRNVKVYVTESITSPIDNNPTTLTVANVLLKTGGVTIPLVYMNDGMGGQYRAVDTMVRVLPNTTYELEIQVDGVMIRGTTTTPGETTWTGFARDTVQYPDSTAFSWTTEGKTSDWLLVYTCNDTTAGRMPYDTPLKPQTTQVVNVTSTSVQPHWSLMPWKGPYMISVVAPDVNFFKWYTAINLGGPYYNKGNSSVSGAIGVFGSASRSTRAVYVK